MVANFIALNIILILFYTSPCFADEQPSSGPYTSRIEKITPCDKPTRPFVKDSPIVIQFEMYTNNTLNNTLLRGNFTVKKDVKNVKHKTKGYVWKGNQWRSNLLIKDFLIDCHSMFIYFMYTGFSVKYNRKNCMFSKGIYSYNDVDINSLMHLYVFNSNYGRVKYRYELFDPTIGTYYCDIFYLLMEPMNK